MSYISGMAEARALKLCTTLVYIKSGQRDDKSPLKGRGFAHVTYFVCVTVDLEKTLVTARCYRWDQQDRRRTTTYRTYGG